MSTNVVPTKATSVARVDMKVEVVVIPVSDVDRATQFYLRLGWRQDVTPPGSGIVQLTPHGSSCSVQFGKNLTAAAPGSAKSYLIVSDIEDARGKLVAAGIEVSEIFHIGPGGRVSGPDPEHRSYFSRATFSDPDGNVLAAARGHHSASRAHRLWRDLVRLRKRPGECASACGGRPRPARKAHRQGRSELARLVRRIHGGGAGWDGAADVSDSDVIGTWLFVATAIPVHTTQEAGMSTNVVRSKATNVAKTELAGQTVVVIGGSSGIGLETARQARSEGADVIVAGRDPERLERAARELGALSSAAFDATNFDQLKNFFDGVPTPIDHVLVTGPGPYYGTLAEFDFDKARRDVEARLSCRSRWPSGYHKGFAREGLCSSWAGQPAATQCQGWPIGALTARCRP